MVSPTLTISGKVLGKSQMFTSWQMDLPNRFVTLEQLLTQIVAMGRHVTRSLLLANRPEGWEFVEKLLVAAQRQEGLRQTILECVDEANPIAYQRMLDENLTRGVVSIKIDRSVILVQKC